MIDSGCTDHMFFEPNLFSNLSDYDGVVNIGQKGRKHQIKGIGKVILANHLGFKISFEKVFYVPELPYNLVSLGVLWKKGFQICYLKEDRFVIDMNGRTFLSGKV